MAEGDVERLVATLHPAVIELYGRDQCAATLTSVAGQPIEVEVRSLTEPDSNNLVLDGVTLTVDGLAVATLYRSDIDQVTEARVATVNNAVAWFTDCGTPEAP